MGVTVLLFLTGLLLLWGGSEFITRNIGLLARALGVKELVITVLGVSVLSSLPELTISGFAILRGDDSISIGNVIGSNFVTLTFVTAVCALLRPIDIHEEVQQRESSWMILSSAFVLVLSLDGRLSRSEGLLLMLVYIPYVLSVLKTARVEDTREHATRAPAPRAKAAVFAALGIFIVIAGSKIALDSGASLGAALGIPPLAMGVLLFAFGTSLPELTISLSATFKHKSDVTIGEVYASNIFTQLVVLGICCVIRPMTVEPALISFAMPFLILAAVVIQVFVTTGLKINRIEALGMLGFYVLFAISQFRPLPSLESLLGF
ncbi:MAG TPA: sodium:calcium antiporter [Candidatus Hydrogenedentes bacterium]|nr:sodium:calcium antiporter [Candidatus Hydrogenedentota bacterium]HNZ20226.1 sodium:calcium antiporter [Candidatus Hydrogenedentota bacterium]HPA05419.1 sodium:calcium antiporter [Candidatus Hydrogenedentota bacterium]HPV36202.1 sodium:calcium antiporter [Candidatus Hydrogenedentota bacterium]HPX41004.1 sodium:calcium antiporter [Candidatus Hydrogenedentota bacterium]